MAEFGRVLVTGAGGFIGGRVVEMLHGLGLAHVRAGVRRWSTAARIGRLPVEIVPCDVTNPGEVAAATKGASVVIHCAVGPGETNVMGTELIAQAALRAGARRFVHLSTIDVYGPAEGIITEETPLQKTGRPYGDSKIDAEVRCRAVGDEGLEYTILRPTIVYGPFSASWTVEFGERLQTRPWPFPREDSQGTCNLIYVDDLVYGIVLALRESRSIGQVFNMNGAERPTWNQYFEALNAALGLPPLTPSGTYGARAHATVMAPVRQTAKLALRHLEAPIRRLYQSSRLARGLMKRAEATLRRAPTPGELALYRKRLDVSSAKAERLLGFRARTDMATGVSLSAAWLAANGFLKTEGRYRVPPPDPEE